jgi:hypothetical protein
VKASNATDLKVADTLASKEAWNEGSAIKENDLWTLVQRRLPKADAGRAYAKRYSKKAERLPFDEQIVKGQQMFFTDALQRMSDRKQIVRQEDLIWLGSMPLYYKDGKSDGLEIYTPGTNELKDVEAQQRITDRELARYILSLAEFQVNPDSENYQALRRSMERYGYRPEFPIRVDAKDHSLVIDGRTRLAVARELGKESEVRRSQVAVSIDGSELLAEILRANFYRRHLSARALKKLEEKLRGHGDLLERVRQMVEERRERTRKEKREQVIAELAESTDSHNVIGKRLGVDHMMVDRLCSVELDSSPCPHISRNRPKNPGGRRPPKTENPALRAEVRNRIRAGKPVMRDELASRFQVSTSTVQRISEEERILWDQERLPPLPDPQPHQHSFTEVVRAMRCTCGEVQWPES